MLSGHSVRLRFYARPRERNGERRPLPLLAVYIDLAAMALDDAVNDR
jgi:hypothetical protein